MYLLLLPQRQLEEFIEERLQRRIDRLFSGSRVPFGTISEERSENCKSLHVDLNYNYLSHVHFHLQGGAGSGLFLSGTQPDPGVAAAPKNTTARAAVPRQRIQPATVWKRELCMDHWTG